MRRKRVTLPVDRSIGVKLKKKHPLRRFLFKAFLLLVLYFLIVPPYFVPADGPVTSGFFIRPAPDQLILPSMEIHGGIDIAAPSGSTVVASKSGTVVRAEKTAVSGNTVELRHWLGFSTTYSHLSAITVKKGDYALKGTGIGRIGATGRATGPHLHFEIHWMGNKMPPGLFLFFGSLRTKLLSLVFP